MASNTLRVESGDVITASLMNYILAQLEELTGGTPEEIDRLKGKVLALETWSSGADLQIDKITGIDVRLLKAEDTLEDLKGLDDLAGDLQDLVARVATLESKLQVAGKVRINGFAPAQPRVGQILSVVGSGFALNPIENSVVIDGVPVFRLRPDSTSTVLKFIVPALQDVPAGGKSVKVLISNIDGVAEQNVTIHPVPAPAPTGPVPEITGVSREYWDNGTRYSNVLFVGQQYHYGLNTTGATGKRFIVMTKHGPVTYPESIHDNSVPDMSEVTQMATTPRGEPANATPVIFEVDTTTGHPPAATIVMVQRPPVTPQ